ncbi:MAG: hypothetical protein ACTSXP_18975, partial [Promethearchaeota archaeon]
MSSIDLKSVKARDLWDEIGFHRPIGGFWYKLILEVGILLIPVLLVSFMLKYIYPYPTSKGYEQTFSGLFIFVFTIFDIGTCNTISRFIADENVKNPRGIVQYIQYFIWYQAITGLVQITVISYYALYIAPNTALAYGSWIMLAVVTKQWPGFPGVFKGTLNALQQFQKKNMIDFIQGEAFQRVTEIVFVLIGKYWGATNPQIGELLGISIGAVFGLYLDDIIASFVSAWFLSKSLKPYGVTFSQMFGVDFDWRLVKRCTFFGLKTGFPGLISAGVQLFSLVLALNYIPQYTTFIVLKNMAIQLVALTQRLTDQDFTPLLTEAYQNGKKKLVKYYNAHALRFYAINSGFAIAIMLTVISIFEQLFIGLRLYRYLFTIPFLIPALIYRASKPYVNFPNQVLIAADKANQILFFNLMEQSLRVAFLYLTIVVFRIQDLGTWGIVYTLTLGDFPAVVLKMIVAYVYIHFKVIKFKLMIWQGIVVPILSCGILFSIFLIFKALFLDLLFSFNFILAIIIGIVFLAALVLVFYFPLTVFLGGWDKNSIRDFMKVKKMAGPSKILVVPIANSVFFTAQHAKLHDRFRFDDREAYQELKDLIKIRDL